MNEDLSSYYDARAREYDRVYQNSAERPDLHKSTRILQDIFADVSVLELACGTGYWSERIGQTARSVLTTDVNASVLEIAEQRSTQPNVAYQVADMYALELGETYSGLFGGFIWSHILLQDLDRFLLRMKEYLAPGSKVAFIDSSFVTGTHHEPQHLVRTDDEGNTYQLRKLDDGSEHMVLKNFPTEAFLREKLSLITGQTTFVQLEYYWIVSGELK